MTKYSAKHLILHKIMSKQELFFNYCILLTFNMCFLNYLVHPVPWLHKSKMWQICCDIRSRSVPRCDTEKKWLRPYTIAWLPDPLLGSGNSAIVRLRPSRALCVPRWGGAQLALLNNHIKLQAPTHPSSYPPCLRPCSFLLSNLGEEAVAPG